MSTHRKIITCIHKYQGTPFAIWEIRNDTKVSTSSVNRTVRKLLDLRMLTHRPKAYANRHYTTAKQWPADAKDVIENYELARIMGI